MSQGRRVWTVVLVSMAAAGLAGCASAPTAAVAVPRDSLAADLEETPRLARLQQADTPAPKAATPIMPAPITPLTVPTLSRPMSAVPVTAPAPMTVIPPPGGAKQTSLVGPSTHRITVRAWVNGKPIFDDEVMRNISPKDLRPLTTLSEAQRTERLHELFNQTLDQIIEQEVVYQEAVRKLEKINAKTLEKLKTLAEQDFEKQIKKIREDPRVSQEEIKEFQRQMRRPTERSFISMEYMRSRIFPLLTQAIGYPEIKEYYDTHTNEFQKVESVKWQDVFIAIGPKHPTRANARKFAEELIAQCRAGADFAKLVQFDDGAAKLSGGEGFGSRRGEIRPAELEEHLFKMRDGEIGPIVELSTGVHIFRLVQRDPGGPIPLNEAAQNQIRSKLRSQLADREYKRIVRELRSRSVIEVVNGGE